MKKNQKLVRALAVVLALLLVGGTVTSAVFAALAEETGSAERDRYEMNITYLEDQQALHITQRLVYHNRQSFALDRVLFSAAGNMYRRESTLMYDAQSLTEVFPEGYAPAGIDLMRVAFGGADADWGYLDSAETVLRVACRLEPGASGEFVFEYYLLLSRNRSMLGEFDTDVRLSGFYFAPGLVNEDDEEFVVNVPVQHTRWLLTTAADYSVTLTIPDLYLPAATGSETSNSAVLTHEGLKRGFSSQLNRPDFAIMNPELTFTLPPYQTACGVVDILMHTMERYMCTNEDNALVDELSEGLLRTVIAAGRRAMAQPDDYEARAALMYAGSLSHNGLTGAGRECGLWAHKLEHEMSGLRPEIAHGAGLAVVWPAYLEFFAARGAGEARLLRYAQRIWGIAPDFEHPERSVRAGIEATRAYFAELGMPKTLRELGLREEDIAVMSGKCTDNGAKILPAILPLGRAETEEIFRMCL